MANESLRNNVDSLVTYLFLKRLVTPITQMTCYKLNLIDTNGKIIKVPETDDEIESLDILTRIVLKLKRIIGTKMNLFNNFLDLTIRKDDYLNKINVKNTVQSRAEVIKIRKELEKMSEEFGISVEDFLGRLLVENLNQ